MSRQPSNPDHRRKNSNRGDSPTLGPSDPRRSSPAPGHSRGPSSASPLGPSAAADPRSPLQQPTATAASIPPFPLPPAGRSSSPRPSTARRASPTPGQASRPGSATPLQRAATDHGSPMRGRPVTPAERIPELSLEDTGGSSSSPPRRPSPPSSIQSWFSSSSSSEDNTLPHQFLEFLPEDLETLKWHRKKTAAALARFEQAKYLESIRRPLKIPVQVFETIWLDQLQNSSKDRVVKLYSETNTDGFLIAISEDAYEILEKLKDDPPGKHWHNTVKEIMDPILAKWKPTFKCTRLTKEEREKREGVRQEQLASLKAQSLAGEDRKGLWREEHYSKDLTAQVLDQMKKVEAEKIDRVRREMRKLEQQSYSEEQAAREKRSGGPGASAAQI